MQPQPVLGFAKRYAQGRTFPQVAANDSAAKAKAAADYLCDGTADEVQIALALSEHGGVRLMAGTYVFADTLVLPASSLVICDDVSVTAPLVNKAAVEFRNDAKLIGRLLVDCQDAVGSVGVRFGGAANCQHAEAESISIRNASIGCEFRSNGTTSCYHNDVGKLRSNYCGIGLRWYTEGSASNVNANWITHAAVQNSDSHGVSFEYADGNAIGFLECEGNGGWGVYLANAIRVRILAGWCENNTSGNLFVADYPAVQGVYMSSMFDSDGVNLPMSDSDTQLSHTFSPDRSILIEAKDYGIYRGLRVSDATRDDHATSFGQLQGLLPGIVPASGMWSRDNSIPTATDITPLTGRVYASPLYLAKPGTVDAVAFNLLTAGDGSSVLRLAFAEWNNGEVEGAALLGTVPAQDVTGTTGAKLVTGLSIDLPAGPCWLVALTNGESSTTPTLRARIPIGPVTDSNHANLLLTNTSAAVFSGGGNTGAVPDPLPAAVASGPSIPSIVFRFA